jgi:hypothetical protein
MEKVMINRIHYHVFSQGFMNKNQYRFTPQKGTTDAVLKIKEILKEGLTAGEVVALVSLDVKGAFDAAWWPGILKELRACGCPKNLYERTKSYFTQRTATSSTNSVRLEIGISEGFPRGSCCNTGFWNTQYNSLLNLKYMT